MLTTRQATARRKAGEKNNPENARRCEYAVYRHIRDNPRRQLRKALSVPAKHLLCACDAETGAHVREKPEDLRNGNVRKKVARSLVGAVISSWREVVVDKPKNGDNKIINIIKYLHNYGVLRERHCA